MIFNTFIRGAFIVVWLYFPFGSRFCEGQNLVVSSCTGTQRNETLTNCVTTPCMDMKTIGIPPCTGTPGQPPDPRICSLTTSSSLTKVTSTARVSFLLFCATSCFWVPLKPFFLFKAKFLKRDCFFPNFWHGLRARRQDGHSRSICED